MKIKLDYAGSYISYLKYRIANLFRIFSYNIFPVELLFIISRTYLSNEDKSCLFYYNIIFYEYQRKIIFTGEITI